MPGGDDQGLGLLLVQLGFLMSRRFGEQLEPLGLQQRHAGMLTGSPPTRGRRSRPWESCWG